jgi:hypothetical protein
MEGKSFLSVIFDFSFSEFVTTRVIKFLLALAMIVNVIITIGVIVGAFQNSVFGGIIALILSPVIYLVMMLFSRIYLELIIVIFRIAENLTKIRESLGSAKVGPTGPTGA